MNKTRGFWLIMRKKLIISFSDRVLRPFSRRFSKRILIDQLSGMEDFNLENVSNRNDILFNKIQKIRERDLRI